MNQPRNYDYTETPEEDEEYHQPTPSFNAIHMTAEDLQQEEEEIRALERKKRTLEDRVAGMEKDIGGLMR